MDHGSDSSGHAKIQDLTLIAVGVGELLSPVQLHTGVLPAALLLGATDAQVPAGAATDQGVWLPSVAHR